MRQKTIAKTNGYMLLFKENISQWKNNSRFFPLPLKEIRAIP